MRISTEIASFYWFLLAYKTHTYPATRLYPITSVYSLNITGVKICHISCYNLTAAIQIPLPGSYLNITDASNISIEARKNYEKHFPE